MSSELIDNPLVNDIKIYWNHSKVWNNDKTDYGYQYNCDFNENAMWEGQFILEEEGYFEGAVKYCYSKFAMEGLIFGIYFPDHSIESIIIVPGEVSAFIFKGIRDAKGYEGQVSVIDLIEEELYGNNHIITRENKEQNLTELNARINRIKSFLQTDDNRYLYEQKRAEFLKRTEKTAEVNGRRK